MMGPNEAERHRAWLWRRVHDATVNEAVTLARTLPDVDPTGPDAASALADYRIAFQSGARGEPGRD
jgi:hypothetical protein